MSTGGVGLWFHRFSPGRKHLGFSYYMTDASGVCVNCIKKLLQVCYKFYIKWCQYTENGQNVVIGKHPN